jgi:hypothetical protein
MMVLRIVKCPIFGQRHKIHHNHIPTHIYLQARTIFPALVGLLPVPGGALFSAPLLAQIGCFDHTCDPPLFSFTNYWFRHIWECWWPVGPGILMVAALTDSPVWEFAAVLMPVMGVMVAISPLQYLFQSQTVNCIPVSCATVQLAPDGEHPPFFSYPNLVVIM